MGRERCLRRAVEALAQCHGTVPCGHRGAQLQGYVQRVADIDGYRRLVMLQHRAIVQRLALADMPAWLQATPAELRNPYSLQTMRWDAATGSLLFEGREKQIRNPDQSPIYRIRLGG